MGSIFIKRLKIAGETPVRFSYLLAKEKPLKPSPCLAHLLSIVLLNLFAQWHYVLKGNEISAVLLVLSAQINNAVLEAGYGTLALTFQMCCPGEARALTGGKRSAVRQKSREIPTLGGESFDR